MHVYSIPCGPSMKDFQKPPKTCWKPAGNLPETCWKPAGNLPETCRKPAGNLPETSSASFRRFPDNPSLTDHTVFQKSYLTAKGSLIFLIETQSWSCFLPIKALDICLFLNFSFWGPVLFSKYPLIKRVWPDTCLNSFFIIQCKFRGSFFNGHQFLLGHYLWSSDPLSDLLSIWPWN